MIWLVLGSACGSLTPAEPTNYAPTYVRSSLVPGPSVPQFDGEPLEAGAVDVSSRVAIRGGGDLKVPRPGLPAIVVPDVDASAGFMAGATSWLSVGGELRVSNAGASSPSAYNTPRLRLGGRSVFGIGPEIGIGTTFGQNDALFVGGSLSASVTRVGWQSYDRDDNGFYQLADQGTDIAIASRMAAFAGGRATPWLAIFAGAVLSPQIVNTGFSDVPLEGSTLETRGSIFMPLLGARVDLGRSPGVFLRAIVDAPVGNDSVSFEHFGGDFAFGLHLD